MEPNKISCLVWPELNDYTGKSETIACFTGEDEVDIEKFISKINIFWNDLSNWIINCNKNISFSQNLKFWFSMEKLLLTEKQLEEKVKEGNERYIIKNYVIKQDDLNNFSWKKFKETAKKELMENFKIKEKDLIEYLSCLSNSFYGPICDTFRQDETNTVSIIKILPSDQMINTLFNEAIKFINSSVVSNKFPEKVIQITTKILEQYLNIPDIVEIK
ncbi:hypothetical protein D8X55_04080 [Malacoplasma penetrans]|uniref:Uncharacterized protein n=1 Tax=Malacoplasma penetrans (strain HF-2) TaxID=272633 RepID=Q8EVQ6_MALP2|nr:hypothetical protein [Malacoplasma penetrans]RXY96309.1 hypothetical protein D8X55_04080 [Malacoplasma penetrans]BAC44294.1 hypothetical protein [Malacoplasma penetrans HF-2]